MVPGMIPGMGLGMAPGMVPGMGTPTPAMMVGSTPQMMQSPITNTAAMGDTFTHTPPIVAQGRQGVTLPSIGVPDGMATPSTVGAGMGMGTGMGMDGRLSISMMPELSQHVQVVPGNDDLDIPLQAPPPVPSVPPPPP